VIKTAKPVNMPGNTRRTPHRYLMLAISIFRAGMLIKAELMLLWQDGKSPL